MWLWTTNLASRSSSTGSTVSRTTHRMSKRDKIGSVRSTWTYSFTASNLHSYNILFSYLTSLHFGFREPLVLLDIMPFCYTSTNKCNKKSHAGFTRLKKIKEQVFKKNEKAHRKPAWSDSHSVEVHWSMLPSLLWWSQPGNRKHIQTMKKASSTIPRGPLPDEKIRSWWGMSKPRLTRNKTSDKWSYTAELLTIHKFSTNKHRSITQSTCNRVVFYHKDRRYKHFQRRLVKGHIDHQWD